MGEKDVEHGRWHVERSLSMERRKADAIPHVAMGNGVVDRNVHGAEVQYNACYPSGSHVVQVLRQCCTKLASSHAASHCPFGNMLVCRAKTRLWVATRVVAFQIATVRVSFSWMQGRQQPAPSY